MEKLKVGIIEDNDKVRELYQTYCNSSEILECILAIDSAERFFQFYRDFMEFDIILLDIGLPGISGLEAIGKIKSKMPDVEVIMFTILQNDETIFKALRLGASGYLLKDLSKVELERQLIKIKEGGAAISPSIARKMIEYFTPPKQFFLKPKKSVLSKKEHQVVNFLVDGLSYNEIADHLDISINGVRYHIKNIYKKLQVKSRSEVVKLFMDKGIN